MKRLLILVLLPVFIFACCKKEEGGATEEKAEAPKEAPAPKVAFDQIKLAAAEGWEGELNKIMPSWTYEKYVPAGDGTNDLGGRFYIYEWDSDFPADGKAYAEKLMKEKGFQDMGYIWNKAEASDIAGGWLVKGECIDKSDAEAKPEQAFVTKIGGLTCRGSGFKTDELYNEAIAACQSIKP